MTGKHSEYETYKHEHELLPKWAKLVSRVLTPKPTDSAGLKVARLGGVIVGAPVAAAGALGAHAYDEIMYNPFTPFLGVPGHLQYKGSRALSGPPRAILASPQNFALPPRPIRVVTIPKVPAARPASRGGGFTVRPQPAPKPSYGGISNRSMQNALRIADASWKLKLNASMKPHPALSTRMKLTPVPPGTSLPYRGFANNLGLGVPKLTLGRI